MPLRSLSLSRAAAAIFFFFTACIGLIGSVQAQSIGVQLRQPPPNDLRVSDLWEVTLTNSGRSSVDIFLIGTIREGNINKDVLRTTSARFTLPRGVTVISSKSREITPVQTLFLISSYKDAFQETGGAPAGDYIVCIAVMDVVTGRMLNQGCVEHRVEPYSQPLLVSPSDESQVQIKLPVFTWTPPSPLTYRRESASITYKIRIVEILGRQSRVAAMQANPAWFEQDGLRSPVFQYPSSAREIQKGRHYAWTISAFANRVLIGQSEVWQFSYEPLAFVPIASPEVTLTPKKIDVLEELLTPCSGRKK